MFYFTRTFSPSVSDQRHINRSYIKLTFSFSVSVSDQQHILPVRVRDGAAQRRGRTAGNPRIDHQRIRAPPQRGTQDLLIKGNNDRMHI